MIKPKSGLWLHSSLTENSFSLRDENEAAAGGALEWYARESDEKFQIVDSKGEAIANFASFTSRARAALKERL